MESIQGLRGIHPLEAYGMLNFGQHALLSFVLQQWNGFSLQSSVAIWMFQEVLTSPNNLDKLHKIDMRERSDENWQTKHAKWINM